MWLSWVLQIKIIVGTLVMKYLMCLNGSDCWRTSRHYIMSVPVVTGRSRSPCNFDSKTYFCFSRNARGCDWRKTEEYSFHAVIVEECFVISYCLG